MDTGTRLKPALGVAACTIAVCLLLTSVRAEADSLLFGVDFSVSESKMWTVDALTGSLEVVGPTGFARLNSLAVDSSGTMYSAEELSWPSPGEPVSLVTLDPLTGAGTEVATIALPVFQVRVRSLAFSPSGELFGTTFDAGASRLFELDPLSGVGTLIGTVPTRLQGLDFSPEGDLYGWDLDLGLVVIDTQTGSMSDVNPDVVGPTIQSLAFSPDGRLLGHRLLTPPGDGALFDIDPQSGETAVVGYAGMAVGLRGLGFAPIPEPDSLVMFGIGIVLLGLRRRRMRPR